MTVPCKTVASLQNRSNMPLFFKYLIFSFFFLLVLHSQLSALEGKKTELSWTAGWKVFTSRHTVYDILVSDDGDYLFAATSGGIEKRSADTGRLMEIFTNISGLPKNEVWVLETDGRGGLWIGTGTTFNVEKSGLVHMAKDGTFILYNAENSGLPDNNIQTIRSDGAGGIWIGTCAGLVRYHEDSNEWEVFNTANSGIPGDSVRAVAVSENGGVWMAISGKGLAYYNREDGWKTFDMTNSDLPENGITVLAPDGDGGVFAGTRSSGLAHYKNDAVWDIFNTENSGIADNYVYSLALDRTGGIWIGSGSSTAFDAISASGPDLTGGISHYGRDGTWTVYNKAGSNIPDNIVNDIIVHETAGVWIATESGLGRYTEAGGWYGIMDSEPGLTGNNVFALADDDKDGIWSVAGNMYDVAGSSKIAHLGSDGLWQILDPNAAAGNSGNSGNSGNYAAVSTSITASTSVAASAPGTEIESVNAVIPDGDGGLWIGTGNGLLHYTPPNGWELFTAENSQLGGDIVKTLAMDSKGGIWAGTWHEREDKAGAYFVSRGVTHYAPDGAWQHFTSENSELPDNAVKALHPDDAGGMWVGTDSGLAHYSPETGWDVLFNMENTPLQQNSISSLSGDGAGGLWIGSFESGVYHYSAEKIWTNYNSIDDPLQSNSVNALCQGGSGVIWMGTGDITSSGMDMKGGIDYYSPDHGWMNFNTANSGLSSYLVRTLVSDGSGGVYAGTMHGGMAHLSLIGFPEQIAGEESTPDITISWFLNRAPFENFDVKYIELQRALSRNGQYETVMDASNVPVRFQVDYSSCTDPRADNCWPFVENHTPETLGKGVSMLRGYRLDTPVTDPAWLEGVPRYYRLSVVMERDGKQLRAANNQAAVFMKPSVTENPRVEITPERSAIALTPGGETQISLFVSSMDLFAGEVEFSVQSSGAAARATDRDTTSDYTFSNTLSGITCSGSTSRSTFASVTAAVPDLIAGDFQYKLSKNNISLSAGETRSLLLTIKASDQITGAVHSDITITPVYISASNAASSATGALLKISAGTAADPAMALGPVNQKQYPRTGDALAFAGNIVPARSGETVIISGDAPGLADILPETSVVTDGEGYFEGTVTPMTSGPLTLKATSGDLVAKSFGTMVLPAKSAISLTSDVTASTCGGDTLLLKGIISPLRPGSTEVRLDITWSGDSAGDLPNARVPQFSGDVPVNKDGTFSRSIVVPGKGFIHVRAQLPDTADFLAASSNMSIPVGQPVGEAIIMVSEAGSSDFRDISASLGFRVYNTLRNRNIPAKRIYYMGSAETGIDSRGSATRENLKSTLVEWALSMISTNDPFDTPLNLYLIGRTEDGMFRLNNEELMSANDLNQYLDEAEAMLKKSVPECKGFPVTIILEGSRSGAWIEKISGKGRMVLTSSSNHEPGQGGYAGYECNGECSFTRYFYQYVNTGWDIDSSFAQANYEILNYYRHLQCPAMDSDGDGRATTELDRFFAVDRYIEYRPSGNLRPEIRAASMAATVDGSVKKGLWAIADDPENDIQGVFCDITDPLGEIFSVQLGNTRSNLFSADFKGYYHKGTYELVYYAEDGDGNTSLPEKRIVNVIVPVTGPDTPPEAPELIVAADGTTVTVFWNPLAEAPGYKLYFAPYPDADYIGMLEMGSKTSISFDGDGYAFYVAVTALNSAGESGYSNISFFDLE